MSLHEWQKWPGKMILEFKKVINYFPGIVIKRKKALVNAICIKRNEDHDHIYQGRVGLTDQEVHKTRKERPGSVKGLILMK